MLTKHIMGEIVLRSIIGKKKQQNGLINEESYVHEHSCMQNMSVA